MKVVKDAIEEEKKAHEQEKKVSETLEGRRCKRLCFDNRLRANIRDLYVGLDLLPADTRLVYAWSEERAGTYNLLFHSKEFPITPVGLNFPLMNIEFRRGEDGKMSAKILEDEQTVTVEKPKE